MAETMDACARSIERFPYTEANTPNPTKPFSVYLFAAKGILRAGLKMLLADSGIPVAEDFPTKAALTEALEAEGGPRCRVVLLTLNGTGAFRLFHSVRNLLKTVRHPTEMVVISDKVSRGQVYTALRVGAKGFVSLNADPKDLAKSIEMAAKGKVYLTPSVADLLANDITAAARPQGKPRLLRTQLSPREVEVVQLLCEGHISREIGKQLNISTKTVENHRYNIYRKCEVDNIAGLMRHAIRNGMVAV